MYYDSKWSELTPAQKEEIKAADETGAGTGARARWQEAKERANAHTNNETQAPDNLPDFSGVGGTEQGPVQTPPSSTTPSGVATPGERNPAPNNPAAPNSTTASTYTPPASSTANTNYPTPEELGMKYKDDNYYRAIGVETAGTRERESVPEAPMSEAAQRIARNEAIIADRGSPNRVAYDQEMAALRESTGYGPAGNRAQDIRANLRERLEDGFVSTEFDGNTWFRQEGATGNKAVMDRLKNVAYGDTPTTFTDLRRWGEEGYVPTAERENVTWRDWTPGGGSDKDAYFKGMYDLNVKYGYTDPGVSFEEWNSSRIGANRVNADRHGRIIDRQIEAGLIDQYGNPTELAYNA